MKTYPQIDSRSVYPVSVVLKGFAPDNLHPMYATKLTFDQVHEIRTSELSHAALAKRFGVGEVTVLEARRGGTWKDHPTPPIISRRKGAQTLTAEAVHRIRTCGLPDEVLAEEYGVTYAAVIQARRGRSWPDHPTPPDLFPRTFGGLRYKGRKELPPRIALPCEPADPVVLERLRMRCQLDEHGCWIWTGAVTGSKPRPSGHHGHTSVNGIKTSTHRAMYAAGFGPIPQGMHVCHTCDKPRCLNPKHLWLGTHTDNMRDSIKKGRHVNVRGKVGPKRTAAEIRVQAGAACECRGECGIAHTRGRCPQAGPGFRKDRYHIYRVIGQRQYCERCAPKVPCQV